MTWELTKELEEKILTQLEMGISLVKICEAKDMPSRRTVLYWQRDNPDFCTKCAHARDAAGDLAADKHSDVMEGCLEGSIPPDVAGRVLSGLQWRASKLAPKKYGDKLSAEYTGKDGAPIETSMTLKVGPELMASILKDTLKDI
jgi:hypothetical protein